MTDQTNLRYHPLDGRELLKWVLLEAGQKLAEYADFSQNRAYHNPKYHLTLTIETYDVSGQFKDVTTKVQESGVKVTSQDPPKGPQVVITAPDVENGPLLTPDKARDTLKEGRYVTKKVGEQVCDVKEPPPQDPKNPPEAPKPQGNSPNSGQNVGKSPTK